MRCTAEHPFIAADLLLSVSAAPQRLAEGIRAHHERWHGRGYPDGLVGCSIPGVGRIITVADVNDFLRSPRRYRPRVWSGGAAAQLVIDASGSVFDPEVVTVFAHLHADGRFAVLPTVVTPLADQATSASARPASAPSVSAPPSSTSG